MHNRDRLGAGLCVWLEVAGAITISKSICFGSRPIGSVSAVAAIDWTPRRGSITKRKTPLKRDEAAPARHSPELAVR